MKQTTIILIFILTTFLCFSQKKEHLEPAGDFSQYRSGTSNEYYYTMFPLLYTGFSKNPYARYTSKPSFSEEYAFSVEKINEKNYIISNKFSENFWYAGFDKNGNINEEGRKSVQLNTIKTEINDELYLIIGELFELLVSQIKRRDNEWIQRVDGATYYFAITDKDEKIKVGQTWSPRKNSLMDRLVKICDSLHSLENVNNSEQEKIINEITLLINDLKE